MNKNYVRLLKISIPVIFFLLFMNYYHNPHGNGIVFSEKIQTICHKQKGMAIVSLDTIL